MIFVDTNVILDVLQDDGRWANWSAERLTDAQVAGRVMINAIVLAELSRDYPDITSLRAAIAPLDLTVDPISDEIAVLAGHRFVAARKQRGDATTTRPLPDFFIGAHALTSGTALLTRDISIYRTYFPDLTLITPETHP